MVTREEFEAANSRAQQMKAHMPKAVSARYDRRLRRVVVQLESNLGIFFSPCDAEGLENASPNQLSDVELSPSGLGLHFPQVDADVYLPSLLEGIFGSERWTANRMGRTGGSSRSVARALPVRENGQKGGRAQQQKSVGSAQ